MGARLIGLIVAGVLLAAGCEQITSASEPEAEAEQLPEIVPNLPEVPTLPPPPFPTTYEDESYSVYGLRQRPSKVLDVDLGVTGYIVEIYEPPACKLRKKEECPKVAAPHMFIADTADQTDRAEQLLVVGYADNQEQLQRARRGRKTTTIAGEVVVPKDLAVGNRVRVKGHFTLISSGGFNTSNGLLEYASHETLAKGSAK
ncbi:MAG: hypothetical protein KJO40_16465 [Deltaproteobacteria bacterium]|nr:hypothetical protein [Deltaproteobacteria bacterium]MBT8464372.1 hypothetical protein [Deltaproteobacteria bacterium]MBT8480428.1 hypothetical protein [Deltaproteobacteria bacterium]NNK09378.1 hypothetical protein [Myxococcales bacterium]NNL23293.1 hypothetical protein [Myxococcales bacterium]